MAGNLIVVRALADLQNDLAVRPVGVTNLDGAVSKVITIVEVTAGVTAFFYLIYSGFMYLTAGGNADQTKKATQGIVSAIIGIFVIVLAYAIITAIKDVIG